MVNNYDPNVEASIYIRQLEEENLRLRSSIKSLRNNNKGMLQGLNKISNELHRYRKRYGKLDN